MGELYVSASEYLQFPIFVSRVYRCSVRVGHSNNFSRLILNRWCRCLCTRSIELHLYIASRQDMTLAPTCAVHCRALCDIGCARVPVARDDDSTDKCNFRYCLLGVLPGVPKKVPLSIARAMILSGQIFPDVNTAVGFAWLLLLLCIWLFYWFCIVRQKCRMMNSFLTYR
jgi:hypothetical protein